MQEVVKRIQARQQEQKKEAEPKKELYFKIVLVKTKTKEEIFPVRMPSSVWTINNGDLVTFNHFGALKTGEVIFSSACHEDDDIWTAIVLSTGKSPYKAVKLYSVEEFDWKEDES